MSHELSVCSHVLAGCSVSVAHFQKDENGGPFSVVRVGSGQAVVAMLVHDSAAAETLSDAFREVAEELRKTEVG